MTGIRDGPNENARVAGPGAEDFNGSNTKAKKTAGNVAATDGPGKRRRRFVVSTTVPDQALVWTTGAERRRAQTLWLSAACECSQLRVLRVALVLGPLLFGTRGHAYAGDGFIGQQTHMQRREVQFGLAGLERAGLIVRVQYPKGDGQFQRRMFPSLPATVAGTPCDPGVLKGVRTKGCDPGVLTEELPAHTNLAKLAQPKRRNRGHRLPSQFALARGGGCSARDMLDAPDQQPVKPNGGEP